MKPTGLYLSLNNWKKQYHNHNLLRKNNNNKISIQQTKIKIITEKNIPQNKIWQNFWTEVSYKLWETTESLSK